MLCESIVDRFDFDRYEANRCPKVYELKRTFSAFKVKGTRATYEDAMDRIRTFRSSTIDFVLRFV